MSNNYFYRILDVPSIREWLKNKSPSTLEEVRGSNGLIVISDSKGTLFTDIQLATSYFLETKEIKNNDELLIFILTSMVTGMNFDSLDGYINRGGGNRSNPNDLKLMGLGAGSEKLKELSDIIIFPLIKKWVNANIKERDSKTVYDSWLDNPDSKDSILSALKNLATQLENQKVSVAFQGDINQNKEFRFAYRREHQDEFSVKFNLKKILEDLLNSTNNSNDADVPSLFGFDEFFKGENKIRTTVGGVDSEFTLLTADKVAEALKEDSQSFAKIVSKAQGIDFKKPTEEEIVNLRQCALITRLLHKDSTKIPFDNYFNNGNFKSSPLRVSGSNTVGHERVYAVDPAGDPNEFYNRCFVSREAKNLFRVDDSVDVNSPSELHKKLYWVFDTDDGIKEIELSLSSDKAAQKESQNYFLLTRAAEIYRGSGTEAQKESRVKGVLGESKSSSEVDSALDAIYGNTGSVAAGSSYYFMKDIEIKYEGTTPATARNDVQVQMTFELSSLQALESIMATIPAEFTGKRESAEVKLYELITLPVTNKISKGPAAYLKNQFNPEYSRVRLKVYTDVNHGCDLIIDLSTIDHSLSRESETGKTTLTINYRGFFEAMMNMPFNDALADGQTLERREKLHVKAMNMIKTNDCKPELINKAMRIEQEIFRREAREQSASGILMRMQTRGLIHGYGIDDVNLLGRAINGTIDSSLDYVTNVFPGGGLSEEQYETLEEATKKQEDDETRDLPFLKNKFFFLGDLLWVISGCLYDGDSAIHRELTKNLNMRFLVGTINVPNPKTRDGSMITINPVCIPVDLTYFVEWFNATIVNKGVTTFPVGIFIKELIERMINNVIYEVCFSSLLPSEKPPAIRVGFNSNFDKEGWFIKNNKGWFDVDDPYGNLGGDIDAILNAPEGTTTEELRSLINGYNDRSRAIFKKDALFNESNSPHPHINDVKPYNYCMIYQQFPTFSHYTAKDQNKQMKNKNFVPTIFYGAKNTQHNYVSNVSFSKTDSPFLREARYSNSSYGNLSLLSNVYDLNFSFIRRKANTFLYPGIILNFVLLDWTTSGTTSPYVKLSNSNGDYTIFDQSNPHDSNTLAHILGFGGYYIVKGVTYKLSQTSDVWEINVTTKFNGSDAIKNDIRANVETENLEDREVCVDAYNEFVDRVNELEGDNEEGGYDRATVEELGEAEKKELEERERRFFNTERVAEVPEEPEEETLEDTPDKQKLDTILARKLKMYSTEGPEQGVGLGNEQKLDTSGIYDELEKLSFRSTVLGYYQIDGTKDRYQVIYDGTNLIINGNVVQKQ